MTLSGLSANLLIIYLRSKVDNTPTNTNLFLKPTSKYLSSND